MIKPPFRAALFSISTDKHHTVIPAFSNSIHTLEYNDTHIHEYIYMKSHTCSKPALPMQMFINYTISAQRTKQCFSPNVTAQPLAHMTNACIHHQKVKTMLFTILFYIRIKYELVHTPKNAALSLSGTYSLILDYFSLFPYFYISFAHNVEIGRTAPNALDSSKSAW